MGQRVQRTAARSVVVALLGFACSLGLVITPEVASAAVGPVIVQNEGGGPTTAGPSVSATLDSGNFGDSMSCGLTARWVVGTGEWSAPSIDWSANCSLGLVAGFGPLGGEVWARFDFKHAGGYVSGLLTSDQPTTSMIGSGTTGIQEGGTGNVTEVCLTWKAIKRGWTDSGGGPVCVPFALGEPPVAAGGPGECSNGAVIREPVVGTPRVDQDRSTRSTVRVSVTFTAEGVPGNRAMFYVVRVPSPAPPYSVDPGSVLMPEARIWHTGAETWEPVSGTSDPVLYQKVLNIDLSEGFNHNTTSPPPPETWYHIVGYGVGNHPSGTSGFQYVPEADSRGVVGVTRAGPNCAAYWGPRLTAGDQGEPLGPGDGTDGAPGGGGPGGDPSEPLPEPPLPGDTSSCDFSITSPSTWLNGGICALVGLVTKLIDAVGGIAGAILDGIRALFIPREGFLDGKIESLGDGFGESSPGLWFDEIAGIIPSGGGGGCAGPSFSFTVLGQTVEGEPLNACSGPVANMASMSKALLSAGLVLFGGFACARGIGSGFGWSPSIGRGESV